MTMPRNDDRGSALVSTMIVLVLLAGLTAGMTAIVVSDTRVRALDSTRTQAFYASHAGLEQLTADLGDLFSGNFAPTAAQINALTLNPPDLGVAWQEPGGGNGYRITFPAGAGGNPAAATMTVMSGPFQGLIGLATPYRLSSTARLPDRSEATLTRTLQTVAIPVFQFGIFSENDLSFFAGPNFNFGGRVHTNANLFVAEGNGNTLTLADRVTAVGEIVRTHLSNGWATSVNYTGNVSVIRAPGVFRNLAANEGSLVGTIGTARNEPTWTNLSTGTYNHNIATGNTGAKRLDLPVVNFGAQPIDLIRRPLPGENVDAPLVLQERFFSLASLRILLSDAAADINGLPGVSAQPPLALGIAEPGGYVGVPFAESPGPGGGGNQTGVRTPANTPVLGGFLKIERQGPAGVWTDVTLEILNLGIAGRQWVDTAGAPAGCAEISPTAVIRLQRMRDLNACATAAQQNSAFNYSPNILYDAREAMQRDGLTAADPVRFGGIIAYVEIDARNLSRWFQGAIGTTGNQALNVNGYTVYFSDRRGNRNAANAETGEYGFEDLVNPASGTGAINNVLDTGEDFNGNGQLESYGATPRAPAAVPGGAPMPWGNLSWPLAAAARPWTSVDPGGAVGQAEEALIARRNPPIFFRRALKLTNGRLGNLVAPGLTIASENPVYVQGDWNANGAFGNPHVATAVIADAVTLLSNAWNDRTSVTNAHSMTNRDAVTTWYRLAVIAGKGISFPQPAGTVQDFGTDGGAHNFLRYLEDWSDQTLNFRGSIVSLYTSRQGNGTYKCCVTVYSPPTRGYNFDTDFLTPALLPPRTPMFRDVNTTGFAQIIRP
ncbi:MAG: pilus assembly PilX N-terminal domain-containing protein [Acidobacteria bacterium]|nr:pilus assembly PilX N-terminal domain-containing protein [Acidobacteriota bacterium]